jgi:hypothetical protein
MLRRSRPELARAFPCVAVAIALVAATGCGGSGAAPAEPARLTQADFVARANGLCWTYNRQIKALAPKGRSLEELALAFGAARRPLRNLLYGLSQLQPPVRYERRLRALIQLGNKLLAYENGAYITTSTYDLQPALVLIKRARRLTPYLNRLSRSMGLRVCAE